MPHRHYHKELNLKLAIGLPVALVLLVGGVVLVHAMQVRHTAQGMRRKAEAAEARAQAAEARGETAEARTAVQEAIRYYDRYVALRRKDDEAACRRALLLAQEAERPGASGEAKHRARMALEDASTRDAENVEVLRKLADLSYELGMPSHAAVHLKRLAQFEPENSELGVKLARCQISTEHYREALATLERVIAQDKLNVEAYGELATLLQSKLSDGDRAEAVLDQMIAANSRAPDAFVTRARFRQLTKDIEKARADIEKAYELDPKNLNVLLAAADLAVADGKNDKALEYLDQAQALHPAEERVFAARARVSQMNRDLEAAADALREIKDPRALPSMVDVLLQKGDVQGARDVVKKMEKVPFPPVIVSFFEARILMAEGQWRRAAYLLERIRPDLDRYRDSGQAADLWLGQCYEQLGLTDRQIAVCQRLLAKDPTMAAARIRLASALLRAGQLERAIVEFRRIRNRQDLENCYRSAPLRATIFRLLMADVTRVPEAERNWTEVEQFLEKLAGMEGADPVQLALMRADVLVRQGKPKEARSLVQELCEANPRNPGLWSTLVALVAIDDGPKQALALADQLSDKLGGGAGARVVRAGLAARIGGDEGRAILDALAAEADSLPATQRADLWQRLGTAYYVLGDRAKAKDLWKKAVAGPNPDPRLQMALFELARETGDKAGMVEAADAVRDSLGTRSPEWNYCEGARLVWLFRNGQTDEKSLVRAKQYLQEAGQSRPNWYKLLLLQGEIAAMENRPDDAIRCFREASAAGQLGALHLHQLVQLLYARDRFEEAKQELEKLGETRLSPVMDRIRVELDERTGELERALDLAAQTVAGSAKATDFLWYGHLLARAKKPEEAEKAFRRATELGPQVPDGWLSLVAVLAAQNKVEEAERALREAQIQLPEDRTPLVLAQGYEILGQPARAEQQYEQAVAARPDDLALLERVAGFYMRTNQPEKAAKYLGDLLDAAGRDPEKNRARLVWTRRSLARTLALTGDYRHHRQALRLLDQNTQGGDPDPADLRLKAAVLAKRPEREARRQAIGILEDLQKRLRQTGATLAPDEQFLLAQLYESVGQWSDCQEQMLDLLARNVKHYGFLAAYVDMLFRHGVPPRDVRAWVSKLESLDPKHPVTIAAQARLLVKLRQAEEAVKLVKDAVPRPLPADQVVRLRDAAALLEELAQTEPALELLKEFAEKAPGGSIVLADYLGRNGSVDEALAQCEAALGAVQVESVLATAVNIVSQQRGRTSPEHLRKVEAWIQQALDEDPRSKMAQLQLARLQDLQGKYDDLIRTYRAFLSRDDLTDTERAAVWNNLAFVLAAGNRNPAEALEMVHQALAVLGPLPNLLDTQAMACLALGRTDQAVGLLREAISDSPTGLRYFHLALAHAAADDLHAAATALERGRDSHQLTIDQIPEIERPKYRDLLKKVESL